jgi:tetratricopeptide (TPR) repeat protein
MIHEGLGDLRRAKNYYDKAFKFIFETGMREETALTLFRRGNLLVKLKKLDQANDDLRMALSIAQSCKYLWELDIRNALIRLAFEKGDASKDRLELRRELGGVLLRAKQTGYKWAESDAWLLLGDLEKITDHSKDAVKAYKHALRLQKQLRDPYIRLTLERLRELVDDYAYDQ